MVKEDFYSEEKEDFYSPSEEPRNAKSRARHLPGKAIPGKSHNAAGKSQPARRSTEPKLPVPRHGSRGALLKEYTEMFSAMNSQLGEIREMGLSNKKAIAKLAADCASVADTINEISGRMGASGGTEAMLKLNEGIKKDTEKIKQDLGSLVTREEFSEFKASINSDISLAEKAMAEISAVKKEYQRLERLLEAALSQRGQNKSGMAYVAVRPEGSAEPKSWEKPETPSYRQDRAELQEAGDADYAHLPFKPVHPKPAHRQILKPAYKPYSPEASPAVRGPIEDIELMLSQARLLVEMGDLKGARDKYIEIKRIYEASGKNDSILYYKIMNFYKDLAAATK
jgi:hypothetical protein